MTARVPVGIAVGNDALTIPIRQGTSLLDPTTITGASLTVTYPPGTSPATATWSATVVPTPWDAALVAALARAGVTLDPSTDLIIQHIWQTGDCPVDGTYSISATLLFSGGAKNVYTRLLEVRPLSENT